MRCPKCGAFLEEGKQNCFMCGASWSQESTNTQEESNNGFYTANTQNSTYQEDYLRKKEEYENRLNNYRDVAIETKKGDRDLIDFYHEHKTIIHIFLLILLIGGVCFGVYKIYQKKNTEPLKEPLLGELYYEVNEEFVPIDKTNTSVTYSKSGDKGSDCSITIVYGSSTSGNHVEDYFDNAIKKLEPEKDREGNILNELEVFSTTKNEQSIHDSTWYRMNVYYRPDLTVTQYSILRNMYLSKVYNSYYYDIELINNANNNFCNSSLDSFMMSLEFIE